MLPGHMLILAYTCMHTYIHTYIQPGDGYSSSGLGDARHMHTYIHTYLQTGDGYSSSGSGDARSPASPSDIIAPLSVNIVIIALSHLYQ
jgi:hypothetical protein